jgi:hypothetical protein
VLLAAKLYVCAAGAWMPPIYGESASSIKSGTSGRFLHHGNASLFTGLPLGGGTAPAGNSAGNPTVLGSLY